MEALSWQEVSVDDLYGGRSFPHGRVRDGSHHRIESEPNMHPADERPPQPPTRPRDPQAPQMPEDQHGPNYRNDCEGWVRGAHGEPTGFNETAEGKSNFDHSPPRNKMRR